MNIKCFMFLQLLLIQNSVMPQARSIDSVFTNINADIKKKAFEKDGYSSYKKIDKKDRSTIKINFDLIPADKNINIANDVKATNPLYVFESLFIVPNKDKNPLAIYNSISQVKKLQGRTYHSATKGKDIPLFEEATRIVSEKNTTPKNDPGKIYVLPKNENLFIRVKDANFGNCYYKAVVVVNDTAIFYSLSNSKPINYFFVPVIKSGTFVIKLYIEPVTEGFMIYAVTGIDVNEFATKNVDIPSAIQKRLNVIYAWIIDGIENK